MLATDESTTKNSVNNSFIFISDALSVDGVEFERDFQNKTEKGAFIRVKLLHNGILVTKIKNDEIETGRFISSNEIIACELVNPSNHKRKCVSSIPCGNICDSGGGGKRSNEPNFSISCYTVDLFIHAYIMKANKQQAYREKLLIRLPFDIHDNVVDNKNEAKEWEKAVLVVISKTSQIRRQSKFLVFVNPKSGSGKAKITFDEKLSNVLNLAGITYTVMVTERSQFAHDFVRDNDLSQWKGIIICGGDGLLYEIINGIGARSDCPKVLEDLTFGIIPCGSGNGLAATILNNYGITNDNDPVLDLTLAAVCGRTSPMDLIYIETSGRSIYSFLSLTWAFMADVDIKSEVIKPFVGNARFTIWALKNILFLKRHTATLHYLPTTENSDYNAQKIPPLNIPLPNSWVTIEDSFVLITAAFQSHLSPDVHFAPESILDDGLIWLIYVRGTVSRYKLFNFLLGFSTGSHIPNEDDEDIKLVKCKAFRILPDLKDTVDRIVIAVDGEELDFGPVQGKVIPKAAKVFVPNG